jgi:pimeloyl-ACP methyl ester carboxylesterase
VTVPPALLQATAAAIGATISMVAGAGHSTYFEKPAEFNAIVRDFLARHR